MTHTRKIFAALMLIAASLSATPVAQASSISNTRVSTVMVLSTSTAFIGFINAIPGNACVASGYYFDVSTAKGKALLTLATSALLANVVVDAIGTGTCTTPTGGFSGESVTSLNVHNQ